jgi:hypothetical protein
MIVSLLLFVLSATLSAAPPEGLLGQWNFDEGKGDLAVDSSGHGRDAAISGAKFVRQGGGYAISLDGKDDYVHFAGDKELALTGPVSVEAWIKPTRPASGSGMSVMLGQDLHSYLLTLYATDYCYWYIRAGGNSIAAKVTLNAWNHIVGTFDGERMVLWINGRQAAGRKSKHEKYKQVDQFAMGTRGRADLPRFKGLMDDVRVYNRALTEDEVIAHLKAEARSHGVVLKQAAATTTEEATDFFKTHQSAIATKETSNAVLFANKHVGLAFTKTAGGFELSRFYGVKADQDFLTHGDLVKLGDLFEVSLTLDAKHVGRDDRQKEIGGLFNIVDQMAGDAFAIGSHKAKAVSWRREGDDTQSTLHLQWKGMDVRENKAALDVHVTVTLRAGDPMVRWRINVVNRSTRYGIERVRFPILPLAPIGDAKDNQLTLPRGRGMLVRNPFDHKTGFGAHYDSRGAFYPHDFAMQFQALYNEKSGHGLYLAMQDSTPHLQNIQIINTPTQIAWRPGHFPANITFSQENYELPYDCVTGPFQGDWFDACQMYRDWALKQTWCRKGPLLSRTEVPKWYKQSPLIFSSVTVDSAEGTFSQDKNLHIIADHFREWLKWADMKLPLNLYTWHEYRPDMTVSNMPFNSRRLQNHEGRWTGFASTYEPSGNYPKLPAMRDLSQLCKSLRAAGGMVCPYIGLEIFDQGPAENTPYAVEAKPYITRDLYGALRTWAGLRYWQPCAWTPWWQNRLKETVEQMLQRENVGGFYLDVMQGSALPCYWTPHKHSAGGGSSSTVSMHKLNEVIYDAVKAQDPEAITTGENMAENMIDVTDGALQLVLWPDTKAPLFATVYQDYISRYGLELSTGVGFGGRYKDVWRKDAFFIECASLFTEGAQVGRLRLRPRDMSLSLDNPDHKEMIEFLGRVVGYYKQDVAINFLAYGQLMRPLTFTAPSPMPMLKYTAIYARTESQFPALFSGVFRAQNGELGIFIVNAGSEELTYRADVELARHGLTADTVVDVASITAQGETKPVHTKAKGTVTLTGKLPGRGITMYLLQ